MELWIDAVQDYSNQFQSSITTRSLDWSQTKVFTSPASISSWEHNGNSKDLPGNYLGGSLVLPPALQWNWNRDNLCLSVWKTGTIDQPASEPDSYWVRFPDISLLRRTRSMIKPRSLPSHFELKADQEQWNSEGKFSGHSLDSYNQTNVESIQPAFPMESVNTPCVNDRGSKVRIPTDPICSPMESQPSTSVSESGSSLGVPKTPRCSTRSNKGIPPVRFTPSKK